MPFFFTALNVYRISIGIPLRFVSNCINGNFFSLTNDSGAAIPFKDIKFSVPGFPAFNLETDEANLIINGNTYTFNGRNGSGAREIDETSVVEGASGWGSEQATSFSLTPLSAPIRFTELSITALLE